MPTAIPCSLCECDHFQPADFDACECGHMRDQHVHDGSQPLRRSDVGYADEIAWQDPQSLTVYGRRSWTSVLLIGANLVAVVTLGVAIATWVGIVWSALFGVVFALYSHRLIRRRRDGIVGGDRTFVTWMTVVPLAGAAVVAALAWLAERS